jgi:hypothetical protein
MAGETDASLSSVDGSAGLEQLRMLRLILAQAIDDCDSKRDLAALSNRYLDVVERIEILESRVPAKASKADEIAARRAAKRKSG